MAENAEESREALFRPSKRRKVFRKRVAGDDGDGEERREGAAEFDGSSGNVNPVQENPNDTLSAVKRPAAKKHGISFSSSLAANQSAARQDVSKEFALVPVVDQGAGNALRSDRFTKPTGNVDVVEDKHLTAYVDSKLAELRSSSATPLAHGNSPVASTGNIDDNSSTLDAYAGDLEAGTPAGAATTKQAVESSRKGLPSGTRNRRPRRQPHVRDASDAARDAMVDAIMKESQVPLYDQSTNATTPNTGSSAIDKDEAAAEAFKAEFLADLEQRKRRKPPAPPAAGQVSSGPKLGGSRAQREKMRALEEAKNAVGKK
ncbi:hypothetical protein M409DRAFT_15857 [Zasmidium cellare ATCC 36951]|uniref:Uncharacterized protein n=1 Tax=Zasmidium cellare ATCC 36951 TaxID=1080233 RepID=A0A6A6D607_ZASCE|nr:uncharacterized protein M409DRAFT_15857 [Zasmidium cellare ATCC 36951]KAF2173579.1 hypothetical protein M409DRAFT_15857 [Zasmidium cellare ATCC 36951]